METLLEHRLRFKTTDNNLYQWAINEIDEHGNAIGQDQLPWEWALYFTATSCALLEGSGTEGLFEDATEKPEREITDKRCIRVQLHPGRHSDNENFSRQT